MDMFVKFWGVRGSIPTPGLGTRRYGGNTACIEIRLGDTVIICDAGTGIRPLGVDLVRRGTPQLDLHLLFTHTHWDHIQGFPFFEPAYDPNTELNIWDLEEAGGRVHNLLSGQMSEDYFPVTFAQLGASIVPQGLEREDQLIGGVTVRHLAQPHPGGCTAFSFEVGGSKVVYCTDTELDTLLPDRDHSIKNPGEHRELPSEFVEFMRDADLVIGDGQYTDASYERHLGWGHPRANTMVDLALDAGVKQLAVFHHDPMETDARLEEKLQAAAARAADGNAGLVLFGAREGLELKFKAD